VTRRYFVRPKADQDLEKQAAYYGSTGSPALGHQFLVAAHEAFALLATHPEIGWRPKFKTSALRGIGHSKLASTS
jgi:plasmid stabilization system protein ParE